MLRFYFMPRGKIKKTILVAATAFSLIAVWTPEASLARFVPIIVEEVPTQRLIRNIQKKLNKNPLDAKLLYALGRAHSIASVQKKTKIVSKSMDGFEKGKEFFGRNPRTNDWIPNKQTGEINLDKNHLSKAIEYYRKSLEVDPKNLTTSLGLAWSLEQTRQKKKVQEAKKMYERIVKVAWKLERNRKYMKQSSGVNWSITVEAAQYLLPLLDPVTESTKINVARLRINHIGKNGKDGPITPIIIPLQAKHSSLDDLLDPDHGVDFNLDGRGKRKWEWISPSAAFLVYIDDWTDVRVTSGLTMFGQQTFWMFWKNGYEALASLDDDNNGALEGSELAQIGVWQDKNQNGISERNEIRSAKALNIVKLATQYSPLAGTAGYQKNGVFYRSGRITPSYDWLSSPITPKRKKLAKAESPRK